MSVNPLERCRERLAEIRGEIQGILDAVEERGSDAALLASEDRKYKKLSEERAEVEGRVVQLEEDERRRGLLAAAEVHGDGDGGGQPEAGVWLRADGRPAALKRGQRFGEHEVVRSQAARNGGAEASVVGTHGSFGGLVRSMSTTSGSAVVPTIWASDIIDRARNFAAVLQAGATIVPMDSKVVQIGRLTTDPTAAFRTEGSTVTASDPVFDNVTLTATTQSALVVGSMEWFMDASDVDNVVSEAIAKAIALNLDLVGLYGSITSGAGTISLATPPNPRGVLGNLLANASSSVLGAGTNGTTQTALSYFNEILDTIYTPKDFNEAPNAMIWNSKLARQYAKAYDSTGQPLGIPADVAALQQFVSNQIPSYTQGTMTSRATDLFVGDWSQMLIGQRLGMTVQTLTERYAELGQIAIIAHWRGDVQLARPRAFSVYRALQGA